MRKAQAASVCLVSTFILIAAFQNCSEVSFQDESEAFSSIAFHDPESRTMIQKYQIDTPTTEQSVPMDVIWIVDNSGSMTQEAAWVQDNVVDFANYLAAASDARMTVVSRASGTNSVLLPENNSRMDQIDQYIGSTNALVTLVALLDGTHRYSSEFLSRWRKDVPKALIVVTDDNSSISAEEFHNRIPSAFANDIKSFNSIIALKDKALSPCMARPGTVYMELSEQTQGQIFNICEEDWSSIFTSLALNLESRFAEPSQTRFELAKKNVERIVAVTVNGEEISNSDYAEMGGYLSISKSYFVSHPSEKHEITIEYIYK